MTDPNSRRRRERAIIEDEGISLIELIVAMSLLAILMTVVIAAFSSFSQRFSEDRSASDSTSVASIGMNELTRVIRSGTEIPEQGQQLNKPVFLVAEKESVTLHAYLDTDSDHPEPVKVRFSINAQRELVESRWAARPLANGYWDFQSAVLTTRVVARQIIVPVGLEPSLFTFVKADGAIITPPTTGAFTTAQLRDIAAVEVTMKVQADSTKRANPVTLRNRVGIPNLGISRVGL